MKYLQDLWDESQAQAWANDQHELLRYRSNLLGADLRITNFGGGNTSAKFELPDPFTGKPVRVLGVKGSGGDLGTAKKEGFALLYLDRFDDLRRHLSGPRPRRRNVGLLSPSGIRSRLGSAVD